MSWVLGKLFSTLMHCPNLRLSCLKFCRNTFNSDSKLNVSRKVWFSLYIQCIERSMKLGIPTKYFYFHRSPIDLLSCEDFIQETQFADKSLIFWKGKKFSDKASCLSIRVVIWTLPTLFVKRETTMLSRNNQQLLVTSDFRKLQTGGKKLKRINKDMQLILYSPGLWVTHTWRTIYHNIFACKTTKW